MIISTSVFIEKILHNLRVTDAVLKKYIVKAEERVQDTVET